jgi:hypothetical protein
MRSHDLGHLADEAISKPYMAVEYACSEHWKRVRQRVNSGTLRRREGLIE